MPKSFASDNYAGIHPNVLDAISNANVDHVTAYGGDHYTHEAIEKFKQHFGKNIEVFFVFNGTAANCLSLGSMTHSFNAIICAETAHINVDECGAPEKFTGCKLLTVPTEDGKLTPDLIEVYMHDFGNQHHVQPKAISISQTTELGTVYSVAEIQKIANFAHKNNLFLHVDGSRLSNAAASLNCTLSQLTADIGVDVLSFGGTKNGMMLGEAVIFFNKQLSQDFQYLRKQGMQLASKMRFISAQFSALLSNNLWLNNALHANNMAKLLAEKIKPISQIKITRKVESNAVFAIIPKEITSKLQEKYFFYIWNNQTNEVRWMTSFDTSEEDVRQFIATLQNYLS